MGTSRVADPLGKLRERTDDVMLSDRHRLRRRIDGARKVSDPAKRRAIAERITTDLEKASARLARRRAAVPSVDYPDELPITARRDEILEVLRDHQVVIVSGETGSGKTTQLPKICLELGRGTRGLIGHTQPRRLAARTVAGRIADELGSAIGDTVGYQVRFTERVGDETLVKLMTDGILLAEIAGDRMLRGYDTLIIDEAHERSLNIDFILGHLKQLLPRRPELKVIITSATIDSKRFSAHFDDAPIIEVSGRTYPVEVRYRPVEDADGDQTQAICDAVAELCAEGPGDILVFLSGEREIVDTADALRRSRVASAGHAELEILPLYARLSAAEQARAFQPSSGARNHHRVVLATNVAETSLTVPGIKYVIDPGTARVSRYSHRLKVQRLPIERISRASADQRKGRCGRIAEGICIRLYSEADYEARPEFTDPEILRTNLASVILQLAAADLGDIATFPFVDPPDRRQISAGVQLLVELGALEQAGADGQRRLTPAGRRLAGLPIDPRLGRMVLEAERSGCLEEVIAIASALSIQDPRERPAEAEQAAATRHARFVDENSDFLGYLHLWNYVRDRQRELSGNGFRRLCTAEFLNYPRIREWQDIAAQLRRTATSMGMTPNSTPGTFEAIHICLLSGLLSHIGLKDDEKREYLGARGTRFAIFPGSALLAKRPRWVMAGELVETSRLWGRVVARIEPEWAERLASHLVKRDYGEPYWSKSRAAVFADEKVTLYGLPIVTARPVNYGRVDPAVSRELFIRHALVAGEWHTHHRFFHTNRAMLDEVADLEERARRRDIMVDDDTLFDFYDQRIPADVVSGRHFDRWWKKARRSTPELLDFSESQLINSSAEHVSESDYPDFWQVGTLRLPLSYEFEPGTEADGVTVHVPLRVLNQLDPDGFDWQVPGLREELVTALIRSLPKAVRRSFVPAPDFAHAVLERVRPHQGSLIDAIWRELRAMGGVVAREDFDPAAVPDHLKVTFSVEDERGRRLASGRDLEALKRQLRPSVREAIATAAANVERDGLRDWEVGTLPTTYRTGRDGHQVLAYPALVDEGATVAVRLLPTEAEQRRAMWSGTRALLLLTVPSPVPLLQRQVQQLPPREKLAFGHNPYGDVGALLDDCVAAAVDRLIAAAGGPAWDEDGFARLRDYVRGRLAETAEGILGNVRSIVAAAGEVRARLASMDGAGPRVSLDDVRAQLDRLVFPGFVSAIGADHLGDLVRYLHGMLQRLNKLPTQPGRDAERTEAIERVWRRYAEARGHAPDERREELEQVRWMVEELRVSFFAQQLGTAYPVSEKRVLTALDRITR